MPDLKRIQVLSPHALLGSGPRRRPSGPMRFAFADVAERGRPTLLHDCFANVGVHYDFKPLRDRGLTQEESEKVCSGNWLRVLREVRA
jgi:hypothetical protein